MVRSVCYLFSLLVLQFDFASFLCSTLWTTCILSRIHYTENGSSNSIIDMVSSVLWPRLIFIHFMCCSFTWTTFLSFPGEVWKKAVAEKISFGGNVGLPPSCELSRCSFSVWQCGILVICMLLPVPWSELCHLVIWPAPFSVSVHNLILNSVLSE